VYWLGDWLEHQEWRGSIPGRGKTNIGGHQTSYSFCTRKRPHSDRTTALGSTQPLNRNEHQEYFLGVKSGRCVRLTTLPPYRVIVTYSGNRNFLEPSGHLEPVMGLIYHLPGNFSAGVKQPERAAYDLPLSNIESRNTWSHTSTPPYA